MRSVFEDLKNAFNRSNNYLNQLIVINVMAWVAYSLLGMLLTLMGKQDLFGIIRRYMEMPSDLYVFLHRPWTMITYFFLHDPGNLFHILFNMLWMYWCGRIVADLVGASKVLGLYVWGGIGGAVLYLIAYNTLPYYMNHQAILVGASASVMAIVVGSATLAPDYGINLLFLGRVRLVYIALFYVVISLIGLTGSNSGGELAHLGGVIAGFLFIKQLQSGKDWSKPVFAVTDFFVSLTKPSPKMKVTHRKTNASSPSSSYSQKTNVPQEEIDKILDKISQSGYESLSKEEKNKLFSASQKRE